MCRVRTRRCALGQGRATEIQRGHRALPRTGIQAQVPAQVLAEATDQFQADAVALTRVAACQPRIDRTDFFRRHAVAGVGDLHHAR